MSIVIFLLLICICLGLIYIVHRYFDKHEFYILAIIYSVLSFIMSFKLVNIFGIDINLGIILLLNTFIVPSLGDKNSIIYQELILNNMPILILYPISLIGTLLFSSYTFNELKKENSKRLIKTILTVVGILFADVFVFIYFSYAFIIRFDTSMMITLSNYLVKSIVTVIYLLVVNKMFEVKKVK